MIDSLAAGFGIITRRPILALLPVLLDVLVLAVPGVTSEALSSRVHTFLSRALVEASPSPETMLAAGVQLDQVRRGLAHWNLVGVLAWQVPTLTGPLVTTRVVPTAVGTAAPLGSLGPTLALLGGLAAASFLLACMYLGRLAEAVLGQAPARVTPATPADASAGGQPRQPLKILRPLAERWLRLSGLRAIQGVILVALLLVGVGVFGLGGGVGPTLVGVVFALALVALLFLFLAEESIFLGGASAWGAVVESFRTVRSHFGATLGLWLLVSIIGIGLRLVWFNLIGGSALGSIVAVLGNAYIATGLTAAVLVFYHDRRSSVVRARA